MPAKISFDKVIKAVSIAILLIFIVVTVYPLIQTLLISIKPIDEFTLNPVGLPNKIRLENYMDAWKGGKFDSLFLNSIIVTFFTIVFTILLASPAGFALAKLKLKGEKFIYSYLILGMIIPFQVIMVPLMKYVRMFHAINRIETLIVIYTATSIILPVVMYTSFYKSIPDEIIEAAKIDGCSIIKVFGKILFPLTPSINATVAILVGMYPWRDFFIPLLFATDEKSRTLAVGIYSFSSSFFNDWTIIFAAMVIQSIPLIILYLVFQKTFVEGITSGAVKG